ncbi:DUF6941 family protein [Rubellicoccus peritrichatus]|uniref:Uncharacterized protein n=1 Tax=Rubellicoccus peritrichatus TaxID=3080537 RepID=A0AAQ3L6D7_9BACT|nr:hypothetical protein [Puniceicoccus sp. CR14]WOO39522.1 hypothetical protein RZN69_12935 [Puniceicoccus sp. CR14]
MNSKPLLLSFVTCDGVHLDNGSGKYYLLGIFSNIRGRQFPVIHPQMFWFIVLTDVAVGEHTLKVSLGIPGEEPVMHIERPFESKSPLHRIHLINEIKNLKFEKAGDYGAVVEVDDEPILVTSFGVTQ